MTHNLVEKVARAIDPYYESSKARKHTAMVSARAAVVAVLKGIREHKKSSRWIIDIDALLAQIEGGSDETE